VASKWRARRIIKASSWALRACPVSRSPGLRVWISHPLGLPLGIGETHVCALWFARDGEERSARLSQAGRRGRQLR
jgi:hypothetical protein